MHHNTVVLSPSSPNLHSPSLFNDSNISCCSQEKETEIQGPPTQPSSSAQMIQYMEEQKWKKNEQEQQKERRKPEREEKNRQKEIAKAQKQVEKEARACRGLASKSQRTCRHRPRVRQCSSSEECFAESESSNHDREDTYI